VDVTFAARENAVQVQQSRWTVSEWEPGVFEAGQLVVQQPWLKRTFRNLRATTALHDSKVVIAGLQLDRDMVLTRTSADLTKIASGVLNFDIEIDAFGGEIRTQGDTLPLRDEVQVSSNTNFSRINVASLASFLGVSEAAGGLIENGTFNFRGSLTDLPRSYWSLRLNARHFQWESRQWDSLVLGATLLDRRVQIPQFELRQGQNELSLSGEFALPRGDTHWWQREFAMNVSGKVGNLTELSALLLPDFQYAAGKATIDGSIRGREQKFEGQLIVSGSDITWRKAPIQELHAAIKLSGNELQLANFDLINREDYVHGRGVINIVGPKQYWGELRASVQDLAVYSSVLQKPLVPEPLAGGAMVNWQGEGSVERYSGTFTARLQKVRSLGKTGAQLHPVNADLEGSYAPGALQFSRFSISDEVSSFSAKIQLGQKSVALSEIQLRQGMEVRLEGDAQLPLDVWTAWPDGDMTQFLSENVPADFKLRARNLRLGEALRLSGWNWPLDGGVTGEVSGKGAGAALAMQGGLKLREGKLPLGWNGDALSNVTADVTLSGSKLLVSQSYLTHASGNYGTHGEIDLQKLRDPALQLDIQSQEAEVAILPEWKLPSLIGVESGTRLLGLKATSWLDLELRGPASNATITGKVTVNRFSTAEPLDLQSFLSVRPEPIPRFFGWSDEPWASCKLNLNCTFSKVATLWEGDLRVTGTGAAPEIAGTMALAPARLGPEISWTVSPTEAVIVRSNGFPLHLVAGSINFRPGTPIDPTLDFSFKGYLHGLPFHASIIGPLSRRISFIDSEEARQILLGLAPREVSEALSSTPKDDLARPLVFPWKPVEPPPTPAAAAAPPASPAATPAPSSSEAQVPAGVAPEHPSPSPVPAAPVAPPVTAAPPAAAPAASVPEAKQ
jgi:hypothetical protein